MGKRERSVEKDGEEEEVKVGRKDKGAAADKGASAEDAAAAARRAEKKRLNAERWGGRGTSEAASPAPAPAPAPTAAPATRESRKGAAKVEAARAVDLDDDGPGDSAALDELVRMSRSVEASLNVPGALHDDDADGDDVDDDDGAGVGADRRAPPSTAGKGKPKESGLAARAAAAAAAGAASGSGFAAPAHSTFVGNLAYNIDEDAMHEAFKGCGARGYDSIVAVRFGTGADGEFKRYAHVDFDSAAAVAAAVQLDGTVVLGKAMRIENAAGRAGAAGAGGGGKGAASFKKPTAPAPNPQFVDRCCVKNLSYEIDEDSLFNAFAEQGITCKHVSFVNDRETGQFYGTSFVTFDTAEDAAWAVACSNAKMPVLGRAVKVEFCPHRHDRKDKEAARPASMAAQLRAGEGAAGAGAEPAEGQRKRTDVARPPSARPEGGTKTCFFGNLAFEITEDNMREFCSACGEIKTIRWLEDISTGEFKGAAFVDFKDSATADKVVETRNGRKLLGRIARVDYAPNTKTKHATATK
jgi:RNA recognition motif-containing protein